MVLCMAARSERGAAVGALRSRQLLSPLLLAAATTWIAVVAIWHHMGAMPGTMGLGVAAFVGLWTLMMAAMMLPSVVPFASFYTRTFGDRRERRLVAFAAGYLLVWAAVGLPVFGLAWIADRLVTAHPGAATALAALIFLVCGLYQLTPLKDRCLAHCHSPLAFTLKHSAHRGRGRDLRAGASHGGFCVGCCWAIMLLLVAFGLMNVLAMLIVAAVVLVEKTWRWGGGVARAFGVASIVLALVVIVHPAIAPGLYAPNPTMTEGTM
jgi:predicted metal-binding membrane protein